MNGVTMPRPSLFSQVRVAEILGVDRRTVRELALAHKLTYKLDPTRAGKMLNRADVNRLARSLSRKIDWEQISA